MDSKTRAKIRAYTNRLEAIFQIGKNGVTDVLIEQLSDALTARELIKITILETCPYSAKEIAPILAEQTGSEVIQVIGRKVCLYRKNPEKTILQIL